LSQQLLEKYKCKFCDNEILAGYRCTDCFIKKIDKKIANPYKDLIPDGQYDESIENAPFDLQDLRGLPMQVEPWIHTFTSAGNATNLAQQFKGTVITPASATMGFSTSSNTCDTQFPISGTQQANRLITAKALRGWRSP